MTIPDSVTSIGDYAFSGCTGLTSVTIGNSVSFIGAYAFSGCTGLTSMTIGNSVTSIGDGAFSGCRGLTSVTIPNSVTSIGYVAFQECSGLTSVTIPASLTSIGDGAFDGCSGLKGITVDIANSAYSSNDGILFNKAQTSLIAFPGGKTGAYTIPDSVTSIVNDAFAGCSGLTSVTIPNSVTSIGIDTFSGCSGLTSVTIPNSVNSIDQGAFYGCSALTSVTIPDSVTSIGDWAFAYCSGLTSVTIPNSVISIGDWALAYCSGLTSVYFMGNAPSVGRDVFLDTTATLYYLPSKAGWRDPFAGRPTVAQTELLFSSDGVKITITGSNPKATGALVIPSTINGLPVTSIGFGAFWGCTQLTSVLLPASLESISDWAFKGASGLRNVTIPSSVTNMGAYAFEGCSGLGNVIAIPSTEKASSALTFGGLKQTYSGSAQLPTIQTVPSGLAVKFSYNDSPALPTNAGTYTVVALVQDLNYAGRATNTLVIAKAVANLSLGNLIQPYDGVAKVVSGITTPQNLSYTLTYNGSVNRLTNAGTYTVMGSISDLNYKGNSLASLIVTKGTATVDLTDLEQSFDGKGKDALAVTRPGNLPVSFTYNGATVAPTNAGSYTVIGTVNTANYIGKGMNTLVISKALATLTLANLDQTFDGLAKVVKVSTTPSTFPVTVTYNGSVDAPTNAGNYPVIATLTDANYAGNTTGVLTISKRTAVVNFSSLALTYTGAARSVKASAIPAHVSVAVTYNGLPNAPTNAGNYTVVGIVEDANYTGSRTNILSIAAVPVFITRQPVNTVAEVGRATGLSVTHGGSPPWTYQWVKDGTRLNGQTNRTLSFTSFEFTDIGTYYVVISNSQGMLLSRPGRLSVATAALHAWGLNGDGQAGPTAPENVFSPQSVTTNVVAAASGGSHSLSLRGDGRLFSFGKNTDGQLGNGTTDASLIPLSVASNVLAIAAGERHSHFVKADGTLWSMGLNSHGQLGNGSTSNLNRPVAVASNVVAVAAGQYHSLFIKADGTLWSMGLNSNGQLGRASLTSTNRPILIASNVVAVAAGQSHSSFIKANGTLFTMGLNSKGQLGNGTTAESSQPVVVASNVVAVAAGGSHTVFVKEDRSLWAMGANDSNQLGNGSIGNTTLPTSVANDVLTVAAGLSHSMFIQTDGTIWGMGANDFGQLGNGSTLATSSPVLVNGGGLVAGFLARGPASQHTLALVGSALLWNPNQPPSNLLLARASEDYFGAEETQLDNDDLQGSESAGTSTYPPTLRVSIEAELIKVISSASAAGFTLEYSSSLGRSAVWSPVLGISNPLVGATEIRIIPSEEPAFYRLQKSRD